MKGKKMLIGLSYIDRKFIEESENDTAADKTQIKVKRFSARKPLLIAAIIALTALLVGCALVYALRLQNMSIGQETYTQTFDEKGKYLEEPIEKTRDILTLFGHSGDNIQKATAEWFDFLETYDPDGGLMDNNPDHAEIPNQYEYTYGCYTPDMVAKVDEIAAKYDLKLLEEWLPFQAWQSDIFLEESGIVSLIRTDSGAEMTRLSGMFYPPYNFDVDIEVSADSLENNLWVTVLYARKDYFPKDYPGGTDLSLYEQWDYTAPDGTALLLALNNKGHGYVIAEPENAMMILSIDGNFSTSAYPTADEVMTREELEAAASVFNYSIRPQILDRASVAVRLEESSKAHEAENAYAPETFGSFADVLIASYPTPNETAQYTFFDLTGDGVVQFFWGNDTYLCEGNVLEYYYEDPERSNFHLSHRYTKSDTETAWMDTDPESYGETITVVSKMDGQWYRTEKRHAQETEISEAEAMAIIEQYPRMELDWKPVMDYPISETQTLRDYFTEKDVRVTNEEIVEIYRDFLNSMENMHYSHYRIIDINGDGVDDLLLKGENDAIMGNTDFYWLALTYRYGTIVGFASDFYLCENGVLECVETRHAGGFGVEKDGHQFIRCAGFQQEILDFVAYNKSTASWQTDWWDEEPICEEEANAILAKYPRIDQGMLPISELLN